MKILLCAAVTSLLLSGVAASQTIPYYNGGKLIFVYPKHGNDPNEGSYKHLPEHISEAIKRAKPGDTIVLMPGTYRENIKTVRSGELEITEECFYYNECNLYKPFIEEGKPVFDMEYDSRYINDENAFKEFCQKAKKNRNKSYSSS